MDFNPSPSYKMHLDFNSCFASIEQQANYHLRGRPIAVAAYDSPGGCILAPSIEAKKLGIKTGMRVKDAKKLCSALVVLKPDPWKYRNVHLKLRKIVSEYTNKFSPKSIDEFILDLKDYLYLKKGAGMYEVAEEIKRRIRKEIGEWLTVSVGIAPNRYLAKVAASLHKPDGLDEINKDSFMDCYSKLKLTDLPHIKMRNAIRLNSVGVFSVLDFYQASLPRLRAAFASIVSYYWFLRLRGWEIDDVDFSRRSYGNSFALPKPFSTPNELSSILSKLTHKMSLRMRRAGFSAKGVHLALIYRDWSFWHKGIGLSREVFSGQEIYKEAYQLLLSSPCQKPVREIAVSCFNLVKTGSLQLNIFEDVVKKKNLIKSVDRVNDSWGEFCLVPARMFLADKKWVPDRIAFGGVKELEEFTIED
jgi:DNA polymerase-4